MSSKKSKPVLIPSKKKLDKTDTPNNPYYCIGCNSQYNEKNNDIHSRYIEDYCRFLGYCNINCWDKLTYFEKHETAELALLNGSILKVKHKHLLKNLKYYK